MSNTFYKFTDNFRDRYEFARAHIKRETVLLQISLILIVTIAFLVRFWPAFLYPWDLSANDPYSQLIAAKAIDSQIPRLGFLGSLLNFMTYVDPVMWYPHSGIRDFGTTQNLGTPMTGVVVHRLFLLFGVNLTMMQASFIAPGFCGTLTVVVAYFLGKELANKSTGLLAAFFLSINPGHIQRSIVGFFDNEAVGVLFMLLTFYIFLKALKTGSIFVSFLAGLANAGLMLSWGGYTYGFQLLALYALVLVMSHKYSLRLLTAYTGVFLPAISISILWPRGGPSSMLDFTALIPLGMMGVLFLFSFYEEHKEKINSYPFLTGRNLALGGNLVVFGGIFFMFVDFFIPIVPTFRAKFITVIIPFFRDSNPISASVAEQLIMTWGSMFNNLFVMVFFIPLASIYLYRKPTENNIFLLVYMLTALYLSGSMVRLILILAPASAIASAKVVDEILLPYANILKRKSFSGSKRRSVYSSIGREQVFLTFLIFAVVLGFSIVQALQNDNQLVQPASLSMQFRTQNGGTVTYGDWYQALDWLSRNTPLNSVIASWWDYGYWLTLSNRTIVVDGATANTTQIGNIGAMFMSTPPYSLKIASYYDINYIVVVVAGGTTQLDNDIGKVQWMVKIAEASSNLDKIDGYPIKSKDFFQYAPGTTSIVGYDKYFFKSLIWGMMTDGLPNVYAQFKQNSLVANSKYLAQGFAPQYAFYKNIFIPVFLTTNSYIRIYQIDWHAAAKYVGIQD